MTLHNTLLLHVADVATSLRFYTAVLDRQPVDAGERFAIFALPSGLGLGLWQVNDVQPASVAAGGAAELGFKLEDDAAVDRCHADWVARGADIILPPTTLDFGRSFVARDPDGHRLRVYAMGNAG